MANTSTSGGVTVITSPSESAPAELRSADTSRRAGVRLVYNSKDITTDIAPWLLSFEFTDGLDKADDLQINIWDDGRWRGAWSPDEGAKLTAEIYLMDGGRTVRFPCGIFTIDEIEHSGYPQTAVIKATSAFITTDIRRDKKFRAWEKVTLQEIAKTIAVKAGATLLYSARNNPSYTRIDQRSQSDLDFLKQLAEREGLRVKLSDGKLIILSQADFDERASVDTYTFRDTRITGYQFTSGLTSAYKACVLKYRVPSSNKVFTYEYTPKDAPESGQILRLNERCESAADAERVAKNRLDAANRGIKTAQLDVIGDVRLLVGQNIRVSGFGGKIDGDYAVEEARHTLWPYTTSMELRKI